MKVSLSILVLFTIGTFVFLGVDNGSAVDQSVIDNSNSSVHGRFEVPLPVFSYKEALLFAVKIIYPVYLSIMIGVLGNIILGFRWTAVFGAFLGLGHSCLFLSGKHMILCMLLGAMCTLIILLVLRLKTIMDLKKFAKVSRVEVRPLPR